MEYLLLTIIVIIIYTEILPTLSIIFEFIRTWISGKILIIQQSTVHIQEDIQNTSNRLEKKNTFAIGFHDESEDEFYV